LRPLIFCLMAAALSAAEPPAQPIPYSHKTHVAMGLKCRECHTMPDPGEMMTFPATAKCMACHSAVKKDSEAIRKLAQFHQDNRPVPWARVYQIPSFVDFSHKAHLEAGASCENCHGKVGERDRLSKEADISMGGCMDCHRAKKAPNDCTFCHEQRD
jgi:cytochrome c7-like protein/class III cytochrome C family protein